MDFSAKSKNMVKHANIWVKTKTKTKIILVFTKNIFWMNIKM